MEGVMAVAECVQVSPEMVALLGACDGSGAQWPTDPVELRFDLGPQPALHARAQAVRTTRADGLTLVVARQAYRRIFGRDLEDGSFHLPHELRSIALAMLDYPFDAACCTTYRLGKAIELLCESFRLMGAGDLVALRGEGVLSLADARRLVEARRLIDERWNEKLTLDRIARACGLNRVKLTRGFREMYDCTVAVALAERRLDEARRLLRTTDKPISSIGYDTGYLNNASFARAFARRYGVSPSDYRARRLAA
jgi:AraC family transcriptional regulator, transcriptional activator of the genes for pyochelin and ferripyochelin receptors